jgi:hypothetical protein
MHIPEPQWNNVFSFGHRELHLTIGGQPVWPIDVTGVRPSEYYVSTLKRKSRSKNYNGGLIPCLYTVL